MGSSNEYRPIGSYPPSGIDVLVVGTGLAGATAVLECMRKGHNVRVLERNQGLNMAGDLFWIGLSATRFLQHWPEMKEQWESNPLKETHMATFKHDGTQMVEAMRVADCFAKAGYDPKEPPGNFQQRPLVYKMLVTQAEKIGVKIEYGKRVVSYFEEDDKAGVVTDEGERFVADVVIAADGVGSKSQALVGGEVRAKPSGRAMWRASFDIAHLDQNQEVKDFFTLADNGRPMLRSWLGPSTYALTFTLPEKVVWVINHDTTGTESENWNATVPNEEVIEGMNKAPGPAKWAPIFEDLVRCTPPNRTVNFGLLWRNPQPNWHSPGARVVKLGDAAHSFLPASTNGGTQAIEDAVSIASCLELAGKNNIAQAVKTHTRLRYGKHTTFVTIRYLGSVQCSMFHHLY